MQIHIIRTLSGDKITIDIQPEVDLTWLDVKRKIFQKKNIDIDSQILIFAGQLAHDDERINYSFVKMEGTFHLVERLRPQFTLETHRLYVVVHNFYETIEEVQLEDLQEVIRINGDENPEKFREIFEKIYALRNKRIQKNEAHIDIEHPDGSIASKAKATLALLAIKKDSAVESCADNNGICFLYAPEGQYLNMELFSYMLEDGTSITPHISGTEAGASYKINKISQEFRFFCADKNSQDPQFIQRVQKDVMENYGEVHSYIELTAGGFFLDRTPDEILKIISGVRNLCNNKIKPEKNDPFHTDIMQFDVIGFAERFQLVNNKLKGKKDTEKATILDECKRAIKILLNNKLDEYEKQYSAILERRQFISQFILQREFIHRYLKNNLEPKDEERAKRIERLKSQQSIHFSNEFLAIEQGRKDTSA